MALAIYTNDPNIVVHSDYVLTDLLTCIDEDPGLMVDHTDAVAMYLAYVRTNNSVGAQRVDDIVNSAFANLVSAAGVNSSVTINGVPITNYGGVTFPPSPTGEILIVYDIEMCNGNGYYGYDTAGNKLHIPRYIILFHELAHAFQYGMYGSSTEHSAISDTNELRFEDGLGLRDPTNHYGGCGSPEPSGDSVCFIATAAMAHFRGDDFERLKWIRDSVLRRHPLGRAWFDALFSEYDQYSARISAAMDRDPALCRNMYLLAVGPLLHFYGLVRDWLLWRGDHDVSSTYEDVLRAGFTRFAMECRGAQYRDFDLRSAVGLIHSLLNAIDDASDVGHPKRRAEDPVHAMPFVLHVFQSTGRPLPITRWAILEPLIALWGWIDEMRDGYAFPSHAQTIDCLLGEWLKRIPHFAGDRDGLIDQLNTWARSFVDSQSSRAPASR